jgi:hypothetical protein
MLTTSSLSKGLGRITGIFSHVDAISKNTFLDHTGMNNIF